MPYEFMVPILNDAPRIPRPLRPIQPAKAKRYMEVSEVLINRFPSDTGGRAIEFLLDLVQNHEPGVPPELSWYINAGPRDVIHVGLPANIYRVVPAMRFEARFGWFVPSTQHRNQWTSCEKMLGFQIEWHVSYLRFSHVSVRQAIWIQTSLMPEAFFLVLKFIGVPCCRFDHRRWFVLTL